MSESSPGAERMRCFRVEVPQADLDDLSRRLAHTRWPDELPGVGWSRGVPLDYIKQLTEYWQTSYDWRKHEARLNELPQYITEIDGQDVHFIHARSSARDSLPLIITHGWPGSMVEFLKIVGPLVDPGAHGGDPSDAFNVVAPSIPGFGFSGPTRDSGWNTGRIARAWSELMRRLGYESYGAQGGDTGSIVAPLLGRIAPEHVVGVHVNGLWTSPSGDPAELTNLSDIEQARLERMAHLRKEASGYAAIQSTRPQTLAYALTDSPVGQLAWIVEKFKEWTDPAAELPEDAVDRDQMLTNVCVYWFTGTAGSSARLYYEGQVAEPSTAPTGVAVFPQDISIRRLAERENNVVRWSEFDRGGHFAAMEAPDLLVADVRAFFRRFR